MDCLLLSAGPGSRLLPLTLKIPKCLLPLVNDRPILRYWIDALLEASINRIFINVFHLKHKIIEYTEGLPEEIRNKIYIHNEEALEPTGEVLSKLRFLLGDLTLIINSDTYIEKEEVIRFIRNAETSVDFLYPICLGIEKRDNVRGKSMVCMNKKGKGYITDFIEKPDTDQPGYSFAGIMLMAKVAINSYKPDELSQKELTKDILPDFKNRMVGCEIKKVMDIGDSLDTYREAYNAFKK